MQPRQASDSLVARSAPRARSWRSAPGRALGGVLLLVLSVLADSRARRAPSFVPAAPLGGLGGARAPRSLSRGRRGRAVLALRGSSASETAEMLRVPWRAGTGAADAADAADAAAGTREDGAGGQRLGGSASETRTMLRVPWGGDRRPRAAARVEGGVDPAIVLRVPWRPPATGGGGEGGAGGAGGAGVEDGAAGGAAAVQSGGDAALAEEEARPREPNKLQQLLAECIRVLPGGGERDQGEIPESLLALLAQLSADDLGAASLTAHVPDMAQGGAAPVCYADLYDSDAFSVTLFSLPPASTLPLHSHPNMTVISRVLLGSVNVTSFATAPAPDKGGGGGMFGMFGGLGGGDRVLGQLDLVPRIVGRNLSSSCEVWRLAWVYVGAWVCGWCGWCVCVCVCVCVCTFIHVNVHAYIHTYIHTYMPTYTQTHSHTHTHTGGERDASSRLGLHAVFDAGNVFV